MESSNKYLEENQYWAARQSGSQEREEVQYMTRLSISNKPSKKHQGKAVRRSDVEGRAISDSLKLAARGYDTSHRLNLDSAGLVQEILLKEGDREGEGEGKKNGLFFLCC